MQINWFTVIAQVINFFILVWLLKKFLYKPVLDAIDRREKNIDTRLAMARDMESGVRRQQQQLDKESKAFDKKKVQLFNDAVNAADTEKQRLFQLAAEQAEAFRLKQQRTWESDQLQLGEQIASEIQGQVINISRKTLSELASVSLQEQILTKFLTLLEQLDAQQRLIFVENFGTNSNPILVNSAYELTLSQQTEIKDSLGKILSAKPDLKFMITPGLVCGIELNANGYQLAWNVTAYLNSVQTSLFTGQSDKSVTNFEEN